MFYLETEARLVTNNFKFASGISLLLFSPSCYLQISPRLKMSFWSWIIYFSEGIKGHIVGVKWCGIKPRRYYVTYGKFQVYNTVSLTTVTTLYMRTPECIYSAKLKFWNFWPSSSHLPHLSAPGNHNCTFYFYEFDFFRLHI